MQCELGTRDTRWGAVPCIAFSSEPTRTWTRRRVRGTPLVAWGLDADDGRVVRASGFAASARLRRENHLDEPVAPERKRACFVWEHFKSSLRIGDGRAPGPPGASHGCGGGLPFAGYLYSHYCYHLGRCPRAPVYCYRSSKEYGRTERASWSCRGSNVVTYEESHVQGWRRWYCRRPPWSVVWTSAVRSPTARWPKKLFPWRGFLIYCQS